MFFGYAHASDGFQFQVLTRTKFDYRDTLVVGFILFFLIQEMSGSDKHIVRLLYPEFNMSRLASMYIIIEILISQTNIKKTNKILYTHQISAGHCQRQIPFLFRSVWIDLVEIDIQLEFNAAPGATVEANTLSVRHEVLAAVPPSEEIYFCKLHY